MWSVAFGLLALVFVASVVLYAALHTNTISIINSAQQLYEAKKALEDTMPRLKVVENFTDFKKGVNVLWGSLVEVKIGEASYLLKAPRGARLSYRAANVLYEVEIYVESCIHGALPSGEAAVIYVVKIRHSIDLVPWVETYAVFHNQSTPRYDGSFLFTKDDYLVRAERVLVYNATSGYATLYVAAPLDAAGIYVVDYPLWIPLTCP